MGIIIDKPTNFSKTQLGELRKLIKTGGEVDTEWLETRVIHADLIGVVIKDHKIVATATLKNPSTNYRDRVFASAKTANGNAYAKELGYIVTHPDFEGQKLCQTLLSELMPKVNTQKIYATTRKPSMNHILSKYGFKITGEKYKEDLNLLIFDDKV